MVGTVPGGPKGAYGARKNCSSTTYMPRIISVRRKYFPALSRELSAPWSHRFGVGRRNPEGGGPDGRAARGALVEKNRAAAGELDARSSCVVGRARANMVIGLVLAMVGVVGAGRAERRVVVLSGTLTLPAWRFCKFNGLESDSLPAKVRNVNKLMPQAGNSCFGAREEGTASKVAELPAGRTDEPRTAPLLELLAGVWRSSKGEEGRRT